VVEVAPETARPLRDVLRDAAHLTHRRLDATLTDRLQAPDGYPHLLQVLHSFHSAADPLLQAWAATSPAAPDVEIPSRAGAFAADLAFLGLVTKPALPLDGLPRGSPGGVLTDPAGVALLYVVAGSSIGARVLLAGLPVAVAGAARLGLTEGASEGSAELWRRTLKATAVSAPSDTAVVAAAVCAQIFELLLMRARESHQCTVRTP
jgi:heme oxygenase